MKDFETKLQAEVMDLNKSAYGPDYSEGFEAGARWAMELLSKDVPQPPQEGRLPGLD